MRWDAFHFANVHLGRWLPRQTARVRRPFPRGDRALESQDVKRGLSYKDLGIQKVKFAVEKSAVTVATAMAAAMATPVAAAVAAATMAASVAGAGVSTPMASAVPPGGSSALAPSDGMAALAVAGVAAGAGN